MFKVVAVLACPSLRDTAQTSIPSATTGAITIGITPITLSRTTAITGAAATTTGATAGTTTAGAGNYRATALQATHETAKEPSPVSGRLLCFSGIVLIRFSSSASFPHTVGRREARDGRTRCYVSLR